MRAVHLLPSQALVPARNQLRKSRRRPVTSVEFQTNRQDRQHRQIEAQKVAKTCKASETEKQLTVRESLVA